MKKRVIAGAAAVLAAAATLGSCELFSPPQNIYGSPEKLYGPPNSFEDEISETTPEDTVSPEKEPSPTLYGPPEYSDTDTTYEQEVTSETAFDPEFTTAAPLYGPPEMFESLAAENSSPDDKEKNTQ